MVNFRSQTILRQAADAAAALASRQGVLRGKVLHAAALALAAQHSYGEAAAKAEVSSAVRELEGKGSGNT